MKNLKESGSFIEWINQMTDSVASNGLWKVIKGTIALAFALLVLNLSLNPEVIFEKFDQYIEQTEQENIEYRRSVDPIIRGELKELIYAVGASRACVMEFHNGTSNFSSLGFLYAAMTYEETREGVKKVSHIYGEVSLSLFHISEVMFKQGFWYGSIEDLYTIDPALSQGISHTGTKWVAALLLDGSQELGFLLLSFDKIPDNRQEIGREIRRVGVSIAAKLDYASNK